MSSGIGRNIARNLAPDQIMCADFLEFLVKFLLLNAIERHLFFNLTNSTIFAKPMIDNIP